jgi:hypothetical protein
MVKIFLTVLALELEAADLGSDLSEFSKGRLADIDDISLQIGPHVSDDLNAISRRIGRFGMVPYCKPFAGVAISENVFR